MAEPGNFEQAHLHQVVKVAANLVRYDLWGHPSAQDGQGRLLHDHLAELELELDERGEIRHILGGTPPPKLQGRVDEPAHHGEGRNRLEEHLECRVMPNVSSSGREKSQTRMRLWTWNVAFPRLAARLF